jgi:hypothetical protein
VIALDLDSHGSLVRRSERRKAANAPEKVVIEPLETERLPQLPAILEGFADVGFTVAIFDTADADGEAVRPVVDSVDVCLLRARPARLDVAAAAARRRGSAKRRCFPTMCRTASQVARFKVYAVACGR